VSLKVSVLVAILQNAAI